MHCHSSQHSHLELLLDTNTEHGLDVVPDLVVALFPQTGLNLLGSQPRVLRPAGLLRELGLATENVRTEEEVLLG